MSVYLSLFLAATPARGHWNFKGYSEMKASDSLTSLDYSKCKTSLFVMATLVPCLIKPPVLKVHFESGIWGHQKKKLWLMACVFFFFFVFNFFLSFLSKLRNKASLKQSAGI